MLKLKSLIKPYWFKIVICVLLLALQATAALSLPGLIGDFISVGIQQMGIESEYPEVIGKNTVIVLKRVLPDYKFSQFMAQYSKITNLKNDNFNYLCDENVYISNTDADIDIISEIFSDAIIMGLRLSDGISDEDIDFNTLRNYGSIHQLKTRTRNLKLSEEEKEKLYSEAESYSDGMKKQVSSMALSFVYKDAGVDVNEIRENYIKSSVVRMIICIITEFSSMIAVAFFAADISSCAETELRKQLINHISRFTGKESGQISSGLLSSSVTTDVSHIGLMIDYGLRIFLYAPFTAVGGTILSFIINPVFGVIILITSVFIAVMMVVAFKMSVGKYDVLQNSSNSFTDTVRYYLKNIIMIRSLSAQNSEIKKVSFYSENIRKNESYVLKSVFTSFSLITLFTNIITAVGVIIGADKLINSDIELDGIVRFIQYSIVSVSAFVMLGAVAVFAPRIMASLKNINIVLSVPLSTVNGSEKTPAGQWDVIFRNVPVCGKVVNFTAESGQVTAITGKTGTGKSLLVKYINRYLEPESGSVIIGGRNIKDYDVDYLCSRVAIYGSKPVVFTGTVKDNLCQSINIDDKYISYALNNAYIDFAGTNDFISNNGENLSGGQRSRLAVSSCFIKDCNIFVFDDCLTAIDKETEKKIVDNIFKLKNRGTIIFVTQSPYILMNADKIVVIDESDSFSGKPEEIINRSPFFKSLISQNRTGGESDV